MKKEENSSIPKSQSFSDSMHRSGRVWSVVAIALMLMVPFVISIYFGAPMHVKGLLLGSFSICLIYLPSSIIEVITYAPMLGTGGTYLAFITGNLTNLKIPCVMNAREIVGAEHGTEESEIISVISVAISALVTCIVLILGVVLLAPLTPILNAPVLQPAFQMVVPALFGALGYQYFSKSPKLVIAPLLSMTVLCFLFPGAAGLVAVLVPISALISIGVARILYNKNKL